MTAIRNAQEILLMTKDTKKMSENPSNLFENLLKTKSQSPAFLLSATEIVGKPKKFSLAFSF
ncbi:MAG: hypothetical protein UT85_C0038G0003 [Candidatus Levybacteria bacterium GW2011_GWA2_40_16]|nr:MAG: hypothetical protein UT85_C0038G0003 [Candidatus Levybacteria bacterium GW2011_GWA2_40_16]